MGIARRVLGILLMVAMVVFVFAITAITNTWASHVPDNVSIFSAQCFGGLIETGDILCLTRYNIEYTVVPDEPVEDSFLNNFISSTTDAHLRSSVPQQFVNSGYGHGVVSVYFSAADAVSEGVVWAAAHQSEIQGNAIHFASPPLVSDAYVWVAQTSSHDELAVHIIEIASDIVNEPEWDGKQLISTTESAVFLTDDGETYFVTAIPQLRTMTSKLFSIGISIPEGDNLTYDNSYQTLLDNQWNAAAFSTTFANLAADIPAPESMWKMIFSMGLATFAWGWLAIRLQDVRNGQIVAIFGAIVVMAIMATIGLVDVRFIGGLTFFMLIAIGLWIGKRLELDALPFLWFVSLFIFVFGSMMSAGLDSVGNAGLATTTLTQNVSSTDVRFLIDDSEGFVTTEGHNLMFIDGEIVSFSSLSPFSGDFFVDGLVRGINGSEIRSHQAGAIVYNRVTGRLNQALSFNVQSIRDASLLQLPFEIIGLLKSFFLDLLPVFITWDYAWMTGNWAILRVFGGVIGAVTLILSVLQLVRAVKG